MAKIRRIWISIFYINLFFIGSSYSFNIDVRYPIIIQKGAKSPNYFGASVSFLKSDQGLSWVIIGAPKGNSTIAAHNDINEPGTIWQCTLGHSQEKCRQVIMSPTGNQYHDLQHNVTDWKNGSWLGGPGGTALDSKNFLACASKWENRPLDGDDSLMHGICYRRPKQDLFKDVLPPPISTPSSPDASRLIPLASPEIGRITAWRNGQAGFSIHLPKSGGNEIVMGAPGTEQYRGSVIQYLSRDDGLTFQRTYLNKPGQILESITKANYFGYSISSGYFFEMGSASSSSSSSTSKVLFQYVAGAPRGNNLAGKVIIFRFPETANGPLIILDEIKGDQTGAYFGATLLVIDINGDGLDDLVIGAPRYSRAQGLRQRSDLLVTSRGGSDISGGFDRFGGYGDEGAVFVYLSNGATLSRNSKIINGGNRPWSQFGTAMASLGDLNKDGYNDFAISAPYESNLFSDGATGAVYIYHGSESGQINLYAQVIRASDIDNRMRGFGISMGGNEDIDNNGFNDIVIGSFNSSQTVILRSKPVVTVSGVIKSDLKKLQLNVEAFNIESCVKYTGTNAPSSIQLRVRITSDAYIRPRRVQIAQADLQPNQLEDQLDYITDLSINIQTCKKIYARVIQPLETSGAPVVFKQDVFISETGAGDTGVKARKMDVGINGAVIVTGESFSSFCKTCAVINTKEQKAPELQLPLEVMCGDDNKCEVELVLKTTFRDISEQRGFLIGSATSLFMDVEMSNLRETAIAPAVLISWSRLTLKRPPKDCTLESKEDSIHTYRCNLGSLLEESQSATVSLEFDMSNIIANEKQLETGIVFNVKAITASEIINDPSQTILLPLYASADAYITGSRILDIFNSETVSPFVVFRHIFEVGLKGPSSVANVWAVFSLPVNLTTSTGTVINVRGVNTGGDGEMNCHPTKGHFSQKDLDLSTLSSNTRDDADYADPDFDLAGIGGYLPKDRDISKESNFSLVEKGRLLIHCDSPFVACMEVTCKAGLMKAGTEALISFVIDIESDVIRDLLKEHKVSAIQVESKGVLILPEVVKNIQPTPNEPDETVAVTIIEKEEYKRVSKWIYILAIVIGLLVLASVVFCLYGCGCFERKKPGGDDLVDSPEEAVPLQDKKMNGRDVEMSRQFSEEENNEPPDFVPQYPTIHEEDEHEEDDK